MLVFTVPMSEIIALAIELFVCIKSTLAGLLDFVPVFEYLNRIY